MHCGDTDNHYVFMCRCTVYVDEVHLSLPTDFMWIIAVIIAVILFVTVVLVLTTVAIAVHKCRTGKGTHISWCEH